MDAGTLVPAREMPITGRTAVAIDELLSADARRCLERFFRWGAAPTVDAYCDLFASDGTLLDADMAQPVSGAEIRDSITRVLMLLPDFHFTPQRVLVDGPQVFVLAANRASLGERALAWDAVYALTLAGDRIGAGRRYYDQAALVADTETFQVAASTVPPTNGDSPRGAPQDLAAIDLVTRADAWNRRDGTALAAPLGAVRLRMAGVARPLEHASDIDGALAAFAGRSAGLRLAPGAVARTADGMAIEWVGSVGSGAAARRFALVELVTTSPEPPEWRLLFNTFGL